MDTNIPTTPALLAPPPATTAMSDPAPSPTEARRSKRKRSQKELTTGEQPAENNTSALTATPHSVDGEKRRKTGAPPATSTPISMQSSYNFNFTNPAPPLMEDSFNPQMVSPSPGATSESAPPLQCNEPDPDTTISEANTSFSLDTSQNHSMISLKNRVLAAKERGTKVNTNSTQATSKDPICKYTKAEMPKVYYSHPTAALDSIDIDQFDDWVNLPDGKLLAHPFGHEVRSPESHQEIKANLYAAIVEITQSETVGVCSPRACPSATSIPITFLIYNISELHRHMLLKRGVWSSTPFTFRVTTLDPVSPDYLFGITNLTINAAQVELIVKQVWSSRTTLDFIESTIDALPAEMKAPTRKDINDFIPSMWIKMLDTKKPGGAATPIFNVLADGNFIKDDDLWCRLRNFLSSQTYAPQFQDPGPTGTDLHRCGICHSVEHPRGLCPFLEVVGWNGPFRDPPDIRNGKDSRNKSRSAKPWKGKGRAY